MPTNTESRLIKAVSKTGHVCAEARAEIAGAGDKLNEVYDHIDAIVGGAHPNATRTEIEAMTISLDDAITESEIASRSLASATGKLREVRGRLDRAMQAYRAVKREEPMVAVAPRQSEHPDFETYEPPSQA